VTSTASETGPFRLISQPVDEEAAARLSSLFRVSVASVERWFGAPFARPFTITLYPDRASFDASFPPEWGLTKTECWMVAAGVADGVRVLSPRVWKEEACEHDPGDELHVSRVLTHELVHVYHGQHNPSPDFVDVAGIDWFVEGLATLASGQLEDEHLLSAREALERDQGPKTLAAAWTGRYRYGVSGSLVAFVEHELGRAGLVELLGATSGEELLAMIGMSEQDLLEGWRAWVFSAERRHALEVASKIAGLEALEGRGQGRGVRRHAGEQRMAELAERDRAAGELGVARRLGHAGERHAGVRAEQERGELGAVGGEEQLIARRELAAHAGLAGHVELGEARPAHLRRVERHDALEALAREVVQELGPDARADPVDDQRPADAREQHLVDLDVLVLARAAARERRERQEEGHAARFLDRSGLLDDGVDLLADRDRIAGMVAACAGQEALREPQLPRALHELAVVVPSERRPLARLDPHRDPEAEPGEPALLGSDRFPVHAHGAPRDGNGEDAETLQGTPSARHLACAGRSRGRLAGGGGRRSGERTRLDHGRFFRSLPGFARGGTGARGVGLPPGTAGLQPGSARATQPRWSVAVPGDHGLGSP
jgi:hypothetical protein